MRRARGNVERIAAHLKKEGYLFAPPARPLERPAGARVLARLEKARGPLPLALRCAFEVLGGCDLRGTHPAWKATAFVGLHAEAEATRVWYTDPLVLLPASALVDEACDHEDDEAQLDLAIAPDATGKAGFSGGALTVLVPDATIDPALSGGDAEESLVEHLRRAFAWGGFPGFAKIRGRPRALIDALVALCEPL
jgi:hypothetical protein